MNDTEAAGLTSEAAVVAVAAEAAATAAVAAAEEDGEDEEVEDEVNGRLELDKRLAGGTAAEAPAADEVMGVSSGVLSAGGAFALRPSKVMPLCMLIPLVARLVVQAVLLRLAIRHCASVDLPAAPSPSRISLYSRQFEARSLMVGR